MRKAAVAAVGVMLFLVTGCASGARGGGEPAAGPNSLAAREPEVKRPSRPGHGSGAAKVGSKADEKGVAPADGRSTPRPAVGADAKRTPGTGKVVPNTGNAGQGRPRGGAADGLASYYAKRYHGRRTANGERFDVAKLTAAHRTLPFGTRVRVTNQRNGKSVVVRVNDRGPFVAGRVIDLSPAAARKLDMMDAGLVPVRLELLDAPGAGNPRVASVR